MASFLAPNPPPATPRPALDGPSKERSGQVHITRLQRAQEGKLKRTKMELDEQNESKTLLESDLRDGKPHHKNVKGESSVLARNLIRFPVRKKV